MLPRLRKWSALLVLSVVDLAAGSEERRVRVDVPSGPAVQTLRLFSQQAAQQILYPASELKGVQTRAVHGEYTPQMALELMIAANGLVVVQDEASGALVLRRAAGNAASKNQARIPEEDDQKLTMLKPTSRRVLFDEEPIVMSAFEVRSRSDAGYRAANSISATRMAVKLRELPMTVSTYTEEFIRDQKPYDLYDVVKWSPGVHQDNVSPQGWVRYNIRGFTSAAVQRNGFGAFRFIDTSNIERVEVVKGPASLLYGQINPGGVINYITKRPSSQPRMEISATLGDHRHARLEVDATGPLPRTGERWLYRAVAMTEAIHQFQDHSRGRKLMVAPSVSVELTTSTRLTVDFEHFERREEMLTGGVVLSYRDGLPQAVYPGLSRNFSYAGEGDYQDFVSDVLTLELTSQLTGGLSLRALYLDSTWDMEWRATGQGGAGLLGQTFIDRYYPPGAGLTPADAMYRRNRWEHQWGGDRAAQVDFVGNFQIGGAKIRALAGHRENLANRFRGMQKNNPNLAGHPHYLKPWDLRDRSTWDRSVPFGLEALLLAANLHSSSSGSSTYGVASASVLDDRLHALAGYAVHRLHNDPTRNYFAGTATPRSLRSAEVPQFGALYRVTEGVSAFLSYSESFLANSTLLRVDNVFSRPAAPSVGKGWEGGLKLELAEGKVSGTISTYRIRATPGGIVTVTTGVDPYGTTLFTDVQGGSQLSEGFEIDVQAAPFEGLQVMAAFSRCDAIYTTHPSDPRLNGARLVATPEWTASLWAKYTPKISGLSGLTFLGGIGRTGTTVLVGNNPDLRSKPYTTIDAGISYQLPSREWEASLSVKNLTDEHYYASGTSWGAPRHVMLTLTRKL